MGKVILVVDPGPTTGLAVMQSQTVVSVSAPTGFDAVTTAMHSLIREYSPEVLVFEGFQGVFGGKDIGEVYEVIGAAKLLARQHAITLWKQLPQSRTAFLKKARALYAGSSPHIRDAVAHGLRYFDTQK